MGGQAGRASPGCVGLPGLRTARLSGVGAAPGMRGDIRPLFCRIPTTSRPPCGARRARCEVDGSKAGRFAGPWLAPSGRTRPTPAVSQRTRRPPRTGCSTLASGRVAAKTRKEGSAPPPAAGECRPERSRLPCHNFLVHASVAREVGVSGWFAAPDVPDLRCLGNIQGCRGRARPPEPGSHAASRSPVPGTCSPGFCACPWTPRHDRPATEAAPCGGGPSPLPVCPACGSSPSGPANSSFTRRSRSEWKSSAPRHGVPQVACPRKRGQTPPQVPHQMAFLVPWHPVLRWLLRRPDSLHARNSKNLLQSPSNVAAATTR